MRDVQPTESGFREREGTGRLAHGAGVGVPTREGGKDVHSSEPSG